MQTFNLKHKGGRKKTKTYMMVNFSALLFIFIFLISFSSAELQVGLDGSQNEIGVNFDRTPFNISTQTVNNSLLWDGFAWDIDRWLLIDGSNANVDVDIGGNDFYAEHGFFEFDLEVSGNGNQDILVSTESAGSWSRITLRETDEQLARLTFHGGNYAGTQAGIAKSNLTLFMSEVDDDDGGMMIGTEHENPLYFITDNIIRMQIDGAGDTYVNGSLFPLSSLAFDIGSGANRWLNLFVQNISAEEMEVYNLLVTENLTVEGNFTITGEINGVNLSNLDNLYLNLSGGNANQNINIGIYNFTTDWINANHFNFTTDTWFDFINNNNLTLNETKFDPIYHSPTQSEAVVGTIDGGTLADVQHPDAGYDGVTFNFSEEVTGLDLRINFTGLTVDTFSRGIMRYKTSDLKGDYPLVQMWNYIDSAWEDYPKLIESDTFATMTQPVFDGADHISDGVAQMRIYKDGGNTQNHYYVDWIAIVSGIGLPTGVEVDPIFNVWLHNASLESNLNGNLWNATNFTYLQGSIANFTTLNVGNANISGDIAPKTTSSSSFGSIVLRWLKGWFVDLDVSGDLVVGGNVRVDGYILSSQRCPDGMAYINDNGGYCIDQYEAYNAGSSIAGSANGTTPWTSVSQTNAKIYCENAGKHLCTSLEWLGAANLQGQIYYLPGDLSVEPYGCNVNSQCAPCLTGSRTGCVSVEGVYDMVGNVWEWVDEVVNTTSPSGGSGNHYPSESGDFQTSTDSDTNKYGNDSVYFAAGTASGRGVLRGGRWSDGAVAGPFCASLALGPSIANPSFGFRCCSGES